MLFKLIIFLITFSLSAAANALGHPASLAESSHELMDEDGERFAFSGNFKIFKDFAYGSRQGNKFDIYVPNNASQAPVIFLVHGGAWFTGDKAMKNVAENKVKRWVEKGFVVISTNYRLLPEAGPLEQAKDVANAINIAQHLAAQWNADPNKFIVIGHSAGGHLTALIASQPSLSRIFEKPVLGTVILDSAAMNIPDIMHQEHFKFYDKAFGDQQNHWIQNSPFHVLSSKTSPMLIVCSTHRTDACPQAQQYQAKSQSFGNHVDILEENLSHKEINASLGLNSDYTKAVEKFMASLDSTLKSKLSQ